MEGGFGAQRGNEPTTIVDTHKYAKKIIFNYFFLLLRLQPSTVFFTYCFSRVFTDAASPCLRQRQCIQTLLSSPDLPCIWCRQPAAVFARMFPLDTTGDAPTLEGCTLPKYAPLVHGSTSSPCLVSEIKQPPVSMLQPDGAVIGGWRGSEARLRPGWGGMGGHGSGHGHGHGGLRGDEMSSRYRPLFVPPSSPPTAPCPGLPRSCPLLSASICSPVSSTHAQRGRGWAKAVSRSTAQTAIRLASKK